MTVKYDKYSKINICMGGVQYFENKIKKFNELKES